MRFFVSVFFLLASCSNYANLRSSELDFPEVSTSAISGYIKVPLTISLDLESRGFGLMETSDTSDFQLQSIKVSNGRLKAELVYENNVQVTTSLWLHPSYLETCDKTKSCNRHWQVESITIDFFGPLTLKPGEVKASLHPEKFVTFTVAGSAGNQIVRISFTDKNLETVEADVLMAGIQENLQIGIETSNDSNYCMETVASFSQGDLDVSFNTARMLTNEDIKVDSEFDNEIITSNFNTTVKWQGLGKALSERRIFDTVDYYLGEIRTFDSEGNFAICSIRVKINIAPKAPRETDSASVYEEDSVLDFGEISAEEMADLSGDSGLYPEGEIVRYPDSGPDYIP